MDKNKKPSESLPTRSSLLRRLKSPDDNRSWQDFVQQYQPLVKGVAKKSGLTDSEVEDAVQETFITAAKYMQDFDYDPARSFKAWLLKVAKSRIADQFRKRSPISPTRPQAAEQTARTSTIDRIPEATRHGFEAKWDQAQREYDIKSLLDRMRSKVNPKHYQIFDAYVIKGWPIEKVKVTLRVTDTQVHKVKSRILELLKKESARLGKTS